MTNVAHILQQRLDESQTGVLRRLSEAASLFRSDIYLVGGTVRDILAGVRHMDLDVMASGGFPALPSALAERLGGEVVKTSDFGTAKLLIDGVDIDLAAARRETYVSAGALPTVYPGSVSDDLARRDFTMNAMAVSLAAPSWGDLLDPHGGLDDLSAGLIRVLHDDSFVDDATRILRAVRYAGRNGHRLEPHTWDLLKRDLAYLDTISGDRIRNELERMFPEQRVVGMLGMAQKSGVLAAVHSAIAVSANTLDRLRQSLHEAGGYRSAMLFAALTYDASPDAVEGIVARLRVDAPTAKVMRDVKKVQHLYLMLSGPGARNSQVVHALKKTDIGAVHVSAALADDPIVRKRLRDYLERLRFVRPELGGNDVVALGVPEGPAVGRILRDLLDARLDGELQTREEEEERVKAHVVTNPVHRSDI